MSDVVELDPSDPKATVCGTCGRGWDDTISTSVTPTPAGRCPFEYDHVYEDNNAEPVFIMVLNDGETFTNLDGCMIVKVPTAYAQTIDDIELFLDEMNTHWLPNRDNAIVGFFEERDKDFRFTSYLSK
jgi:hypothetical protein